MTALKKEESSYDEKFCSDSSVISVVDKFRKYRLNSETSEKEIKESKILIEQLKDDIYTSRELEKHLRSQISSMQIRLTQFQGTLNKLTGALEKQKHTEIMSEKISKEVEELGTLIRDNKQQLQKLNQKVLLESDLEKKNENLKRLIDTKESELHSVKEQMQSLIKENFTKKLESEEIIKNLKNDLEKLKRENEDLKKQYDGTLFIYKKQIENNEKIIEKYEKERKSLLEDFGPTLKPQINSEIISSTSLIDTRKRDTSQRETENKLEKQDEVDEDIFQTAIKQSTGRRFVTSNGKRKSNQQFSRAGQKPCLEFTSQIQKEPPKNDEIQEPKVKRRLFLADCNHYFD